MTKKRSRPKDSIEVRYVSSSFDAYSRSLYFERNWTLWAEFRYALETCSGRQQNHVTYLRGYTLDKLELKRDDPLPDILLVRRCVMPWGLRQHVPPECHDKYKHLQEQYLECKRSLETLDRTFLERIHSSFTDYVSHGDPEADAKAHHDEYTSLLDQCKKLNEQLTSFRQKAGQHPSEHEVNREVRTHKGVSYEISFVTPHPNYICSFCSKLGHHYKDACVFFDEDVKDVSFKVGAHKMKKFQLPVAS